jgi:molybdate transport system ATP-binding protein
MAGSSDGVNGTLLDVEFAAPPGVTVLFGASGAGKTTILHCIAGVQRPDAGHVSAGGVVLFDAKDQINVPTRQRHIGYLLQNLALFPHMTAQQNIEYGLAILDKSERANRTQEVAESFGISELLNRRPSQISGGERQRVALARALVTRPRVLLLDEPMSALDAVTKSRILDDLRRWNVNHAVPILYVTHEREEIYALGDHVLVLESGRLVASGSPYEALSRPQYESVAQLAGFENIFDCSAVALHEEQGTMTCRIQGSEVLLEAPLTRLTDASNLRLGIRAGDILLATEQPTALSARNVLPGVIVGLRRQDVTVITEVDCGIRFVVHLTPGAARSLELIAGRRVWLVIKSYSCHILQRLVRS